MKIFFVALLIASSNAQFEKIDPLLLGGAVAVRGEFPSAVFIRSPGTPNEPFCGGTIIDNRHVLTSAKCVLNNQNQLINPFWYTITAGDLSIIVPSSQRVERKVSSVFVHPNFNPTTRNNDLAVLRVSEPYPDFHNSIEPVIRSNRLLADGTVCRFVAWGSASNAVNAPIQTDLRVINAPIINRDTCNQPNVHAMRVLTSHICAGSVPATNPVTGACGGNIGSGLYCNNQLAGLLTFGQSCGLVNIPGVYTNLLQYRDWIDAQLTRTDNPPPGWTPTPN